MYYSFQPPREDVDHLLNCRKPHSTPSTLFWLQSNFQLLDGACIPRCEVYYYYLDFCSKGRYHPVNAASFGKVASLYFDLNYHFINNIMIVLFHLPSY